jgi:hypothetical protein
VFHPLLSRSVSRANAGCGPKRSGRVAVTNRRRILIWIKEWIDAAWRHLRIEMLYFRSIPALPVIVIAFGTRRFGWGTRGCVEIARGSRVLAG